MPRPPYAARSLWLPAVPFAVVSAVVQVGGVLGRAGWQGGRWHGGHWQGGQVSALGIALLLTGPLAILVLNRFPLVPLAVSIAAAVAYTLLGLPLGPVFVAPVLALVLEGVRRRSEWAGTRRREWADRADRTRSEERVAMARDLHDVLGHSLTLINVHAGAALHTLDAHPENARPALETIKTESHQALEEVRAVLDRLRDPATAATRAPGPTLRDVPGLLSTGTGIDWTLTETGDRGELAAAVDAAAYRVVQEAMTNTHRHARARTGTVAVTYAADEVTVEVGDDGTAPSGPAEGSGGQGLVGMRARVEALGGTLGAGPARPGGWRVVARLPRHPRGAA